MIHHQVTQGSAAWLKLRSGIPTASCFDRILTPKGKPSTQATRYMHTLLAERMMQHPTIEAVSWQMRRGSQLEAEAVRLYEFTRELDTIPVGFCTTDDGGIGASPDRFVGDDGLLEIKCPAEHTHVAYLLAAGRGGVDDEYRCQTQGQLWVTGRQWLDLQSYNPEMPPALIRVERDEKYIAELSAAVRAFSDQLEDLAAECRARGWIA